MRSIFATVAVTSRVANIILLVGTNILYVINANLHALRPLFASVAVTSRVAYIILSVGTNICNKC